MRDHVKHIHFVGIGGSGMSGIAQVLQNQGYKISGSDLNDNSQIQILAKAGAHITMGHSPENIDGCDVVVISSAVSDDNPEIVCAREKSIPVVPRAEMLGELMRFSEGIAIAGTHGKTTTTSLVAQALAYGDLDPTFIVGGLVNSVNSNSRLGKGKYLIAEADESDASFLHLQPMIAVVTNIDLDHMQTYQGDVAQLKNTFIEFLHNLPFYGLAVLCIDDPVIQQIRSDIIKPVITYGEMDGADYQLIECKQDVLQMYYKVKFPDDDIREFQLPMPGKHNVLNAIAAIVVADQLDISMDKVEKSFLEFQGIGRRFQNRGEITSSTGEFLLIDDYAHHPQEINATLIAAKQAWPNRRLIVVFQPHRYTRTRDLLDDFAYVLESQNPLIILEVYSAGELPISAADGRALCKAIRVRGDANPLFVETLDDIENILDRIVLNQDVVIMLGAGDISKVAARFQNQGKLRIT